jgi:phospholipase C
MKNYTAFSNMRSVLHLQNHPQNGQDFSAKLIASLKAHPDVYAKTVLFINYDEGGAC